MFLSEHPWCRSDVKKLRDAAISLFGPFPQRLDELSKIEKDKKKSPAIRNAAAVSGIGLQPSQFPRLDLPRLRRHQMPQRVCCVIAANAASL
jgi:hypothetical protein